MTVSSSAQSLLTVNARDFADCRLVAVSGRVDHTNSEAFASQMTEYSSGLPSGGGMVVDLGGLEFITSSGLRALLIAQRAVKKAEGQFIIVRIDGVVREVFRISKFDALMTVAEDVKAAVSMISTAASEAYSG